jgi:acetyltransferase-like isoleucine patch superfamily enzyme
MINFFDLKKSFSGRMWAILLKPFLKKLGAGSRIVSPLKIKGLNRISINESVIINPLVWLQVEHPEGSLQIDSGTVLGHMNHIVALKSVHIGKNVLIADKVYISDNLHGYEDVLVPIIHQPIKQIGTVVIGDGSWLGENVCVIGVKIGKNCVIGSNSVVTKDIPDYCVAVGSPAKIIKRYCTINQKWLKTDKQGVFLLEV